MTMPNDYDVIVVGSGGGGMTAALTAQAQGLSVLVIEKDAVYGGTTAVSGGGIWVPCNDTMEKFGIHDSVDETMTYLRHLTRNEVPEARLLAYVRNAKEMVRFLRDRFDVRFTDVRKYPDYFPDEGGKPGGRGLEPDRFDARRLGDHFAQQRESYTATLLFGRIAMTQAEAHVLLGRSRGWIALVLKMLWRYWTDFRWRFRTRRDRHEVFGQALVSSLRLAMLRHDVPLRLRCGMQSLIEEDGRVVGVVARSASGIEKLYARRGVILACGGFESNQQMREEFLPAPTHTSWTITPGCNSGDGIRVGRECGAALKFMNLTWGTPSIVMPGATHASGIFMERQLPGCVAINSAGRRFVNEAVPYTEFVYAMYDNDGNGGRTVPCWLVFDATYRKKYPLGSILPGSLKPDAKLPKDWLGKVYWRAETLDALAAQIDVDAAALCETVGNMNAFARTGVDTEFHKGENVFDRYYGDPHCKPNPCLGAIAKAPFYAVKLHPGEIGTKGGLLTDENARVLRDDGSVINGLYAVGNTSAAVMGRTYAGPGSTIGPAMAFGYLAALDIARSAVS